MRSGQPGSLKGRNVGWGAGKEPGTCTRKAPSHLFRQVALFCRKPTRGSLIAQADQKCPVDDSGALQADVPGARGGLAQTLG